VKFWDSSALVPLVSREASSAALQKLARNDPSMVVWAFSPVEIYSALARKRRRGESTAADLRQCRRRLDDLSRAWHAVQSVDLVLRRARKVLDLHDLRAPDSLQLAAALVACGEEPSRLPFVALDDRLAEAAEREGFSVLDGKA